MRSRTERVSGLFLGSFGLALAVLMVSTLLFEGSAGRGDSSPEDGSVEVSVFFLERSEWRAFLQGIRRCTEPSRQLGRIVQEADDRIEVETFHNSRKIRFIWRGVRGEGRTRDEARRLLQRRTPPIAIVGSSNTLLTRSLSTQLQESVSARSETGPLLLIPWATSVALLDIYPARTFRFCTNNRRHAELIVDCLRHRTGRDLPAHVILALDSHDPYSRDLLNCFRAEIARTLPTTTVSLIGDDGTAQTSSVLRSNDAPSTDEEQQRAKKIWSEVVEGSIGETWVILPVANVVARRMIAALNASAPRRHDMISRPVTVICGDAVGRSTLASLAKGLVFPIWSVSSASDLAEPGGLEEDVQVQAEIVASLLIALDRDGPTPTSDELRVGLIRPGEPAASAPKPFGRPIAFETSGERTGIAPGVVICLPVDSNDLQIYRPGRWKEPRTVDAVEASR